MNPGLLDHWRTLRNNIRYSPKETKKTYKESNREIKILGKKKERNKERRKIRKKKE